MVSESVDQTFVPPDPRNYVDPATWLAAWCAAQPDRGTNQKLEELARLAGCSVSNIQQVIRGARRLSVADARSLVAQLPLSPPQREHLLDLFELQHARPKAAGIRRKAVLDRVARHAGVPEGSALSLIEDGRTDESASAALSAALMCLENDRPPLRTLLRCAVPGLTLKQLQDAAQIQAPATRLGARFVALDPPGAGRLARFAHQGALSFALDGLMRLRAAERDFRRYTASVDEEGFQALDAPCRRLEAGLVALAEEAELRPPSVVLLHQIQRLVAAGPVVVDGTGLRWRPAQPGIGGAVAAPSIPSSPMVPGRPHPTGVTHFPTWVAMWRAWAAVAGHPCSDAWLNEQTGFARSTIYELCAGTARFLPQHVFPFLCAFGFEGDKAAQLAFDGMALVASVEGDVEHQARVIAAMRGFGLEQGVRSPRTEAHFVQARWYASVLFNLTDLNGFRLVPGWCSRAMRGRVDPGAVAETLDALQALGLVQPDEAGGLLAVPESIWREGPHQAVAQYEQYRGLLAQHRADLDLCASDLHPTAWLLALPHQAMSRLQRLRATWHAEILAVLQEAETRRQRGAPMDRVVLVSTESFPMFKLPEPKPRRPVRVAPKESR